MKYIDRLKVFFNHRNRKIIFIIFIVTVVVQSFVFVGFLYAEKKFGDLDNNSNYSLPVLGQDSPGFVELAQNINKNHFFSVDNVRPETFRTPGYPLLIYLCHIISNSFYFIIFVQILFSATIAILIWLMAKKLLPPKVAIFVSLCFSLAPSTIFHSTVILSEVSFVLFFLLSFLILFFTINSKRNFFLSGIMLGISALIRPVSLYLPILFLIFIFFSPLREKKRKTLYSFIIFFILGFALIVTPWYIRNWEKVGVWGFSSINTYNMAYYNVKDFVAQKFGANSQEVLSYNSALMEIPEPMAKSFEQSNKLKSIFMPYLKKYPVSYTIFHITTTTKFFFSSSVRYIVLQLQIPAIQNTFGLNNFSPDLLQTIIHGNLTTLVRTLRIQFIITIDRIFAIFITFLAVFSLFVPTKRFYVLLFLATIFYFAVITGPVSIPRYRLPVEPFILILACFSGSYVLSKLHWI